MRNLIIALLAGGVGIALLAAGYRFARILIPIVGFISGFSLGAAVVADWGNSSFMGTVLGILVGLFIGLLFGALAYFYYAFAVVVLAISMGYWIGSEFILFFGISPGFLSVASGMVIGTLVGIGAIVYRAPKYLLMVLTSFVGATVGVGAVMLLFHKIPLDAFSYSAAQATISNSLWWAIIAVALAAVGMIVQVRTDELYQLEEWGTHHSSVPPVASPTHA